MRAHPSVQPSIRLLLLLALGLAAATGCLTISDEEHASWLDRDGDGVDGVNDCDDSDPEAIEEGTYYQDADGDGLGDAQTATIACGLPDGYTTQAGDECDTVADVFEPGRWYADSDGDGFGDVRVTLEACVAPSGYLQDSSDCDDSDPEVNPNSVEVCNSIDDDCNEQIDEPGAVGEQTFYEDADGDGYGDAEDPVTVCDPPDGYVEDATDCDDVYADINPGAKEICNDGIDNDCNPKTGQECRYEGELDVETGSSWTISGYTSDAYAGVSIDLGNIDGDGQLDALIGADAVHGSGAAYVLSGPFDRDIDLITAEELRGEPGDYAGSDVAIAPDLDGDGQVDLIVGARGHPERDDFWELAPGTVYLLPAAAKGDLADVAIAILHGDAGDSVGDHVEALEDFQGTGGTDVAVGSILAEDQPMRDVAGAVYLIDGSITGELQLATEVDAIYGSYAFDFLGAGLLGSDLDGDGQDELLVGALQAYEQLPPAGDSDFPGGIFLYDDPISGNASLLDADAHVYGEENGDFLGSLIASAGDVDLDGREDLLVGYLGTADGSSDSGYYLITDPIAAGDYEAVTDLAQARISLDDDLTGFGRAGVGIGDHDGDGQADVALGEPYSDRVFVFYGPVEGNKDALDDADLIWRGDTSGELGWALAAPGDVDGDGRADLMVSEPGWDGETGRIHLITGATF